MLNKFVIPKVIMSKKIFLLASMLFIVVAACDRAVAPAPPAHNRSLTVRFVYVGQADATLITTPDGKTMLFDAATSHGADAYLIPLLDSLGIDKIDFAIASHMHSDHIGGFDDVFESGVSLSGYCYDHGGSYPTRDYDNYIAAIGAKRRTVSTGDTLHLGDDVDIVCYASGANGLTPIGENEKSVAVIVSFKGFDLFLAGDLTGTDDANQIDVESYIAPSLRPVEFYQADHHGSRYCSNATILAALQPEYSVISCGIDNMYGFPTAEAVARMAVWSVVYRTDISGTITVDVIDSSDYEITTQF